MIPAPAADEVAGASSCPRARMSTASFPPPLDFPRPGPALDREQWLAALLAHQERHGEKGPPLSAGAYLRAIPELGEDREAALELLVNEWRLSRRQGRSPQLADYQTDFAFCEPELTMQFLFEEALARGDLAGGGGAPEEPATAEHVATGEPLASRYTIEVEVGRGGMGRVFRGRDNLLGRVVALKFPFLEPGRDVRRWARFAREAKMLARLNHPAVCEIYDLVDGSGGRLPFLVMPLLTGPSLAEQLARRGRLPGDEAARLVLGVADALQHVHARGVVHRDIKPSNLRFDREGGTLKILDFGLGALLEEPTRRSRSGQQAGTVWYMAPEQLDGSGSRPSAQTDVYALGVVLYELLSGEHPFPGEQVLPVIRAILESPPRPLSDRALGLAPELERICLRCLDKRPAERYAGMADLADDLRRYLGEPIRSRQRLSPVWLTVALLGCVGVLLAVLLGSRRVPSRAVPRQPLSTARLLAIIRTHLRSRPASDRRFQRYFLLDGPHNNLAVPDQELARLRAAVSFAVNSLSWEESIARPEAVGEEGAVLAVDLRALGWHPQVDWRELLRDYPYGLRYNGPDADQAIRSVANEVYDLAGTELPFVRADWLVATALQAPRYETLLGLPGRADELAQRLKVRALSNRAGLKRSEVTAGPRVFVRHETETGSALWRTYDLPAGTDLAAGLSGSRGPATAGGQIHFHLPNGLLGYLVVDARGRRVAAAWHGPAKVERAAALSCLECHEQGPRNGFMEEVGGNGKHRRDGLATLRRQLEVDKGTYQRARAAAVAPFLDGNADLPPVVIPAVRAFYERPLGLREVAAELGLVDGQGELDSSRVRDALARTAPELQGRGLGALRDGGTVSRASWQDAPSGLSLFHEVASLLGVGVPKRFR